MKITFVALAALVIVGVASYADAAMPGMSQEQTQKLLAAERAARFAKAKQAMDAHRKSTPDERARMGHSHHDSAAAQKPPPPKLSVSQTRQAIADVLAEVKKPENMKKINALKHQVDANPDNAMMALMQLMPMATEMLGDIMKKYGFDGEGSGNVMQFFNALQGSEDEEVQRKAKELRQIVVPASMQPMVESMFAGNGQRDL